MKTILFQFFLVVSVYPALSQEKLSLGMQLPPVFSTEVINYPNDTLRVSDFKGKMMILDLWNHGCISCLQGFEKLDALQKKFANKIQIILVNKENKDSTLRFFAKRKRIKPPDVPMLCGATDIYDLFPGDGQPFYAWLDSNQIVRHITSISYLTSDRIGAFLRGEKLVMPVALTSVAKQKTWVGEGAYYSSFLSSCSGNTDTRGRKVNNGQSVMERYSCASILELFKYAYEESGKYRFNTRSQVLLLTDDNYSYQWPDDPIEMDEWKPKHGYAYELVVPAKRSGERYKLMQKDLERFFGLTARVEKRKMNCLVLVTTGNTRKLMSKGGTPTNTFFASSTLPPEDTIRLMRNLPFSTFIEFLNYRIEKDLQVPFVNHVSFNSNIDIQFNENAVEPLDITQLRLQLKKYNLALVNREEWTDVLVIRKIEYIK